MSALEWMSALSDAQQDRFFTLVDHLRALGYVVLSEPLEGQADAWLDGLERNLGRIEDRLADVNKAFRTRGRSKAALYYLTENERFDPGFGIHVSADQTVANRKYKAKLARAVARWDAAFGDG